ncbi:hypothetical protein D3C84_868980 [compost metagenome]
MRGLKVSAACTRTNRFSAVSNATHNHSLVKRVVTRARSPHTPREHAATAANNGRTKAARVLRTRPPSISVPRKIKPPTTSHCDQYGTFVTGPASTPLSCRSASNNPQ